MKQKTVLVLPGSNWQVRLVKKIKELGHKVLVVNPFENSPCFPFADGHLQSDIFEFDRVIKYCKENKVDAVISDECDIAMPLVAKIGETLGLVTLSTESAHLYTDKFAMREFCKKNGLLYPQYEFCKNVQDAIDLFEKIKRPIIIKPLDCNASKGVFKASSIDEIKEHFDEAMSFSRIEKAVLAERYIEGTEFTIDGIKTPENHYTLAISEKRHFKHNVNIASDLLFSHYNKNFDYEELKRVNDEFIKNSPLEFGFTHAEYKCENGEFYLIEIAARGGGNMISSVITQYLSGYDTYKYLIDCSLGKIEDADFSIPDEFKERTAILKFFKTPDNGGVVKEIKGLDYLDNNSSIVKYLLNFKVGDVIENAKSDSARIGFFIACCESMDQLNETVNAVDKNFKIILGD